MGPPRFGTDGASAVRLAILSNGPGEVWGWARPVLSAARARGWNASIFLLPCPFASGREEAALQSLGVSVTRYGSALHAWFAFGENAGFDAVLQLGGDLMFGRRLAQANRAVLACYTYGMKKGLGHCDLVLAPREGLLSVSSAQIVGDLVLDSLKAGDGLWKRPSGARLILVPGSRPSIRSQALGLLKETCEKLRQVRPDLEVRTPLSPFASDNEWDNWHRAGLYPVEGTIASVAGGADFAITQPGTNTLELMYLRVPFLTVLPFSFLAKIPVAGLLGIFAPQFLRSFYVKRAAVARKGKMAWPNRMTGREIVPELVGDLSSDDLSDALSSLLSDRDRLTSLRQKLEGLAQAVKPGAPDRICDLLEEKVTARHDR